MEPEEATKPLACRETCGRSCSGAGGTGASPAPPPRPRLRPHPHAWCEARAGGSAASRREAQLPPNPSGQGARPGTRTRPGSGGGAGRAQTPGELAAPRGRWVRGGVRPGPRKPSESPRIPPAGAAPGSGCSAPRPRSSGRGCDFRLLAEAAAL